MSTPLPVLGLVVGHRPPPEVLPLLTAVRRWCRPAFLEPRLPRPAAALVLGHLVPPGLPVDLPYAIWAPDVAALESPLATAADVVVSRDPAVLADVGHRGLYPAVGRLDPAARPLLPFVRSRLRAARQLPRQPLLEFGGQGWSWAGRPGLPGAAVPAAMACAAAVIATGTHLATALSWAAPAITDEASAEAVGAVAGRHVEVAATADEARSLARQLIADDRRATELAWAGRRLAEQRLSLAHAASDFARRLGLPRSTPDDPLASLRMKMTELGTPPDARIADRAADFVRGLSS